MEYHIDLGSFIIDADSEDDAYAQVRAMIDEDPSMAIICNVEPV